MGDYHSAMAKHVKHAYHGNYRGGYPSQAHAKKDYNAHIRQAKEYRTEVKEEAALDEARINPGDYHVTSEKSKFGGHRPKIVHKEKGHTMYHGAASYKKPEMARKHAEAYLSAYATRGDTGAQNASAYFARANKKHLYVKEEVNLEEDKRTPQEKVSHAIRDHNYQMMRALSPAERAEKIEDHKAFLAAMKKKHPEVRTGSYVRTEEVEQIDELKTSTLDSYRSKARKEIIDADANDDTDTYNKRTKGYTKASKAIKKNFVQGKYEEFEQDAETLSNEEFETKWLAPQVNELDEAFEALVEGRPKVMIQHPWDKNRKLHPVKDKDVIAKLRAKGYTNLGDRPSTDNPINQLRKASTSMTGGHHVTLHTGEKHHVTGPQASRILDKHAGMKTAQEKLDYQDKLRDKDFLKKEAGQ